MKKNSPLIKVLIVVIPIVLLVIAVPLISKMLDDSKKNAFIDSVKLIIKELDVKMSNENYDIHSLSASNIEADLGISNINYKSVEATISNGQVYMIVVGQNKWEGLQVKGTLRKMEASLMPVDTPEACFVFDDATKTITDYKETDPSCLSDVVIPSTINGVEVRHIADFAFDEKGLTSVVIPKSIISIGIAAFYNNKIASVTISNGVTTIGNGAFENNLLTTVIIPNSVKSIGSTAFFDNDIAHLGFGNNITYIGTDAFNGNQLTTVIIPSSVTTIAPYSLYKSGSSNPNLVSIINKTGKSFDWGMIINGDSAYDFTTGTVGNMNGNIIIQAN